MTHLLTQSPPPPSHTPQPRARSTTVRCWTLQQVRPPLFLFGLTQAPQHVWCAFMCGGDGAGWELAGGYTPVPVACFCPSCSALSCCDGERAQALSGSCVCVSSAPQAWVVCGAPHCCSSRQAGAGLRVGPAAGQYSVHCKHTGLDAASPGWPQLTSRAPRRP